MPNKKINALDARTAVSTDLMLVGDPATGTAYKSTVANLPLVPYSGATGDVNLGEFELKAGQVEFDQTPTGTAGVGVMRWNDTDGTVDLGLKGGNVTLQVGQEQVLRVVNKTGADLLESQYRAVRIRLTSEGGSQGQRLAVVLAQGNNDPDSTTTIGIVTETIANNQEGFITTSGEVRGINTTGSLQSETWADGDIIYLSPTIPGGVTIVKPTAPNHMVVLGYVIYAHAINGKIFVKVDNGYELSELHDVYAPSPTDGQGIFWNTANSRYQNNSIAGVLGFTPISGSGVANQLTYWNGTGSVTGSAGLVYNDTTGVMTLSKNQNARTSIEVTNTTSGITSNAALLLTSDVLAGQGSLNKYSNTTTSYKIAQASDFILFNSTKGDIAILNDFATGKIKFAAGGSSTAQMTLTAAGRLLLGTTTESTFILDVNGTARMSGSLRIGDTALGQLVTFTQYGNYGIALQASTLEFTLPTGVNNKFLFGSGTSGSLSPYLTIRSDSILSPSPITITNNYFSVENIANWANPTSSGGTGLQFAYYKDSLNNFGQGISALSGGKYDVWFQTGAINGGGFRWYQGTTEIFRASALRNILIGTSTDVATAKVTIESTTQGFLPPRMTTTQRDAIASPATGLIVYQTDGTEGLYEKTSSAWRIINGGGGGSVDELQVALLSQVFG